MAKFNVKRSQDYHTWASSFIKEGDILQLTGTVRSKVRKVMEVRYREWRRTTWYYTNEDDEGKPMDQGSGTTLVCAAFYDLDHVTNSVPYAVTDHMIDKVSHKLIDGKWVSMTDLYKEYKNGKD